MPPLSIISTTRLRFAHTTLLLKYDDSGLARAHVVGRISTHFKGMNSELVVSGYSQLKAPNFPNQISDDDIEKDTVATEIRRHNIPEPLEWVFYTAANCKSPGFVANG